MGWCTDEVMEADKKGEMSIKRAALQYEVPKTTSQDRLSGGAKPYLNKAEEDIGFGKTRKQI